MSEDQLWRTVEVVQDGEVRSIRYQLVYSSRIKSNMTLKVDGNSLEISIRLSPRMSVETADQLIRNKSAWIARSLADLEAIKKEKEARRQAEQLYHGGKVLFRGERARLSLGASQTCVSQGEEGFCLSLAIPIDSAPERIVAALQALMKVEAKRVIEALIAPILMRAYRPPVSRDLSNAKRRWGSCNSRRVIRFSWRLIFLDDDLIRYVIAHELAHLIHMDHSLAFWAEVERMYPPCQTQRARLKAVQHLPAYAYE